MIVIDARIAAMEIAKIMAYDANMENAVAGYHYTKDDFMDVAKEMLGNVPMLDVEPARYGRWVPARDGHSNNFMCTSCYKIYGGSEKVYWNYCPSCGAKMENEE